MDPSTSSLWLTTSARPTFPKLAADATFDVVVIGGGITGLTAALQLTREGKRVAVVEQSTVIAGETGHTTAHITEAVDARYRYLDRAFSKDVSRQVAAASRAAIERIAANIRELGIDCHFKRVPGYLYTENRNKVAELKAEAASAKDAGLDATWTEDVPLPFATRGAVLFENQAQFHPAEYLSAIARHLASAGCAIYEQTHVTAVREGEPCRVETDSGVLTATAVVMATNTPIHGFTTIHTKQAPYRTYAAAYSVDHAIDGLFWDTADPYHYTRWQETDAGTYMIVGGEDHKVGQEEDTEQCFARLQQYVIEKFGAHPQRFAWSGQVLEPADGLPFIGGSGPIFISTGYAGQGMTFGTIGGVIVSDLILGRSNEWADLFAPSRVHLRGAMTDLITENKDFPTHLAKDRLTSWNVESKDTRDVRSGDGKIIEVEGRKLAVYRDDAGRLCALSTVCTHMKCDVAWNNAEKTWDCPCHGSRFAIDGKVVNGPAREPLERFEVSEGDDTAL